MAALCIELRNRPKFDLEEKPNCSAMLYMNMLIMTSFKELLFFRADGKVSKTVMYTSQRIGQLCSNSRVSSFCWQLGKRLFRIQIEIAVLPNI